MTTWVPVCISPYCGRRDPLHSVTKKQTVGPLHDQGRGWEPGQVRQKLQGLIDKYANVPKKPAYIYTEGEIGMPGSKAQTEHLCT